MATIHKEKKTTTLAELEQAAQGEIIEMPGWREGERFAARLRRASLTGMIRAGKIPNPLIGAAQKLYEGAKCRHTPRFEETAKVVHLVVEEALVEPKIEAIRAANLELTEEQVNEIYFYAVGGAKALENFRAQSANRHPDPHGGDEPGEAERADGD